MSIKVQTKISGQAFALDILHEGCCAPASHSLVLLSGPSMITEAASEMVRMLAMTAFKI